MKTLLPVLFLLLPLLVLAISPLFKKRLFAGGRVILLHSTASEIPDISSVSSVKLQRLLQRVAAAGLKFATLEEALNDHSRVAITFDDGYDDFMAAWPILRARGVPVTLFVPTYFVGKYNEWDSVPVGGKRRHLDANRISSLAEEGVCFGSHGHLHRDLTALSAKELRQELERSKCILEELTARPVRYLAYPYGKFNSRVARSAAEIGYRDGFTSVPGGRGPFAHGRIPFGRLDTSFTIDSKLHPDLISGAEYLKCLIIAAFSHLAPAAKRLKIGAGAPISID